MAQTFTASNGASGISFWYKMSCPDTLAYDWATAILLDVAIGSTVTLLPRVCTTGAWQHVIGTVTSGHNYIFTLTSHDDNFAGDPTFTLFDDVTLR